MLRVTLTEDQARQIMALCKMAVDVHGPEVIASVGRICAAIETAETIDEEKQDG